MTLSIKDYEQVFRYREAESLAEVTWTKFPVARSSVSFRRLMCTPKGRTAFCVFVGVLRLVSRGKTGGSLVVKDRTMTPEDIYLDTGIPERDIQEALDLLLTPEIGWLVDGLKPAHNRDQTGAQPGNNRPTLDSRARAAAESREDIAAAPKQQSARLCSVLLGIRHEGRGVFDDAAAAAIAEHPNVSHAQVEWALERMNERCKGGKVLDNPAGYLRSMLENQRPPDGWVAKFNQRQILKMANGVHP